MMRQGKAPNHSNAGQTLPDSAGSVGLHRRTQSAGTTSEPAAFYPAKRLQWAALRRIATENRCQRLELALCRGYRGRTDTPKICEHSFLIRPLYRSPDVSKFRGYS